MTPKAKNRLILVVAAALVCAALGALTWTALCIEASEWQVRQENELQQNTNLALWRMDSALAPILAQEAARKPSASLADPIESILGRLFSDSAPPHPPLAKVRFEITPSGFQSWKWSDTQAPAFGDLFSATTNDERRMTFDNLWSTNLSFSPNSEPETRDPAAMAQGKRQPDLDYQQRAETNVAQQLGLLQSQRAPGSALSVLRPEWRQNRKTLQIELLLLRNAEIGGERKVRVIVVDWDEIERWLLSLVADLIPSARLQPALGGATAEDAGRRLASIPATLQTTIRPLSEMGIWTPLRIFLLVSWIVVVGALAAFGYALRSATELGERRGRFVSAVTHELRTPLTTFQMYSQMLADGMVAEEKTRQEYLQTLKKESERLSRIVENVLLYARVEGKRAVVRKERISAEAMLGGAAERLSRRAEEAGMRLALDLGSAQGAAVETDPHIVEQILANLVDNSCKYAAGASDRRLHTEARAGSRELEVLYFDHGPGIPESEAERVFLPFERGSRDASSPTPGIGLGLTLSRAMARELGGDLRLEPAAGVGARFVLTLPLSPASS